MIKPKDTLTQLKAIRLGMNTRKNKIKLDLNENLRGCSPKVIEAIRSTNINDIAIYPEYPVLMEKIACHYNNIINPENILLTDGADDAIRCIMDTYIEPGDEIVIPVPTFPMFTYHAKLRNAKIYEIVYNRDFSFPLTAVLNSITLRTRMIVIVNPGSPTGTSLERNELIRILKKAKNSVVVLDETYYHFAKKTYIELINGFSNLVIIHTFSKVYGLAGIRLGYIVSDSRNIKNLCKVNPPFQVNSLAVIAGCAALDDTEFVEQVVKDIETEKKFLYQELKKMMIESRTTDTIFILVNFGKWCNKVHQKLMERDILVKKLCDDPLLTGYLRITIGTHQHNVILIETLKEILNELDIHFRYP